MVKKEQQQLIYQQTRTVRGEQSAQSGWNMHWIKTSIENETHNKY